MLQYLCRLFRLSPTCAPWSTDVDKFLALVVESRLIDQDNLRAACADFTTAQSACALDELCSHLTSKQILTEWQCKKLRQGKWKGFLIDD
jgi:hypothetical protein